MEAILLALKELDRLYSEVGSEMLGGSSACEWNGTATLSESIIRNRHLIVQLQQAQTRLVELAGQWQGERDHMAEEDRDRIAALAEKVRSRASRLMTCCKDRAAQLKAGILRLEHDLGQIRQGTRYMQSSKAARVNYPKFIDSHG